MFGLGRQLERRRIPWNTLEQQAFDRPEAAPATGARLGFPDQAAAGGGA